MGCACSCSRCPCCSGDGSIDGGDIVGPAVDDVDVEIRFVEGSPRSSVHSSLLQPPHMVGDGNTSARTHHPVVVGGEGVGGLLHAQAYEGPLDMECRGIVDCLDGGMTEFPVGVLTTYDDMMEATRSAPHRMEDSMENVAPPAVVSSSSTPSTGGGMSPTAASPHQHGRAAMLNNSARIKTSMNDSNESPNYTTIHHVPVFPRVASSEGPCAIVVRQGTYAMEFVDESTTPLGSVDRASRRSATASARSSRSVSRQRSASPRQGRSLHSSPLHDCSGFVQATFLRANDDDAQQGGSDNISSSFELQREPKHDGNPLWTPRRSPSEDALAPAM